MKTFRITFSFHAVSLHIFERPGESCECECARNLLVTKEPKELHVDFARVGFHLTAHFRCRLFRHSMPTQANLQGLSIFHNYLEVSILTILGFDLDYILHSCNYWPHPSRNPVLSKNSMSTSIEMETAASLLVRFF